MAKKKRSDAPELIEEFEGAADRVANWVSEHAWLVGGGLVAVLLAVWGIQAVGEAGREEEAAASNALDAARSSYLLALGAAPGAFEIPELANPAAAEAIHEEYLEKFQALANDHPGTVAGTLARFESATLMDELGRSEQTAALWQEALAEAVGNPRLEGMLQQRIAAAHEDADAWSQAATAHEAAAAIADYPLRYWAMVDAGRCWLAAGEPERALGFFDQVETEAPELRLPDHIKVVVRELREASAAGSKPLADAGAPRAQPAPAAEPAALPDAADLTPPDGAQPAAAEAPDAAAGEAVPEDSPPTPQG